MNAYDQLRQAARNKRDAAIREIRAEYRRELLAIQKLRVSLEGETVGKRGPKPSLGIKRRTIVSLVQEYMPRDRQFTVTEMREILLEVEPDRRFYRATLKTTFANLRRQGDIKPVKRIGKGQVLWQAMAATPPETPLSAMQLPDAVALVLGECGPLRPVEIVVALQERGYRREANPRILANSLQAALKRCSGRFACGEDGRWGLGSA